ncbi:BadF/BadG/BcrA/BcrD ATPase family protein [Asticcacaulis solisilvae]|uniref:BadF/BadG/BcrA/BcrD ATPase family protein n=1 Tax=Asticcacaulis solisilvae TaxID=1217274 RepID=UPI003FD86ABE
MKDLNKRIYIGVDGGGTQCRVRIRDGRGHVLAEATGGAANVRLGQDFVWANISAAIDDALQTAGLPRGVLTAASAGFGLAGVLKPEDCAGIAVRGDAFASLKISSDAHAACLGAFGGEDGAIQIIGTGNSSYAVIDGIGIPRGGWGFALAERASGAALGRDALLAALQAHDGFAVQTPFTRALIDHFGAPVDIVDWSERATPRDFAALAPMVFAFVKKDDAVAVALANRLASDCAFYVDGLIALGAPQICLLGGLAHLVRPLLPARLSTFIAEPRGDALDGALLLARQGRVEASHDAEEAGS